MYNEERKQRYMKEKMNEVVMPEYCLMARFRESEFFEKELQKDICDFSVYEITEFYKMLNFSSLGFLAYLNSQFSMYTQWCLQSNLVKDNQNHFLEFSRETLNNCLNKVIIKKQIVDRDTILQMVRELVNPRDQFIILALFEIGKAKDFADIWGAKLSQISENDHTMKTATGRIVHVSDEFIQLAKVADTTKEYYGVGSAKQIKRTLLDEGYIVKDYANVRSNASDFNRGRNIYRAVARNLKYLDMDYMSATTIVESGKLYMIKTKAQELGMTNKDFIYSKHIGEVAEQYGCKIERSNYALKYGDLL